MRRVRAAVAGVTVAAMTLGVAAPVGAQEEEGPASLGLAVNATQGPPGALVLGKVDTGDVAEHCVTDVEAFGARFQEWIPVIEADEFLDRFTEERPIPFDSHDQVAWLLTGITALGLTGLAGPELIEEALPQTFVMTFADIETQEPVGEMGNFDPGTGEGSVVVPDVEPGLWAVAAACVGPSLDPDFLEAGIRANGEFLEDLGVPATSLFDPEMVAFMQDFLGSDSIAQQLVIEFLTEIGPTLVENIVEPDAFGAVLFCVHNAEGECPEPEPPGPPGEPIEPAKKEEPAAAQPVVAVPAFTG